jgi:hypothetical protein
MPLHKRTISGNVTDTLAYTVETADAYGAQVVDVRFYDGSGNQVTPTGGLYDCEWSPNGKGWAKFSGGCKLYANQPIADVQANGFVKSARVVPDGITGAETWEVDFRLHGIGDSGAINRLLTAPDNCRVSRLRVDSQQTSFEANEQFRFHITFSDLWGSDLPALASASGTQLVLKFSATNAVNIIMRTPEVYLGGFVYRVWADTENVTFDDDLLAPMDNVFNVNGNLTDSRLETHPVSGVSVQYATGTDIFRSADKSPNGTIAVTDGNKNVSTNEYSPNDVKSGVVAGRSFYLVFDTITNQKTGGMFTIAYEEIF